MSVEVKVPKDIKVILGKDWKRPTAVVEVSDWHNPITEEGIKVLDDEKEDYEDYIIDEEAIFFFDE